MYKSLESKIRDMLEGKTGAISVTKDRDTMEHDPNDQVTVGTYKSKHFEISPEAQKLFSQGIPKNSNAIDAEHLAIHHDKLFALVKGAMVKKQVSDTDLENAKDHMSKIQYLTTKLGLEGEINYLQPHVEKLFKHAGTEGNPFTSKPTEYTQEPRDFDVDNTKQFITRAAKAERKVKVIDDEFNPEETEMVADKNLGANPAVVEAAKKVMEKLDPVGKEDKDVNNDGKVDSSDNYLKKRRNAISSAMRAARQKEVQKKVDAESKKQWKKPPQAGTLSAMKKEEVEQVEEAVTSNPGHGYHGQHSDNADQKYSKMHAKVRSLTGTNSTMAKHYLDSTHGRHLAGYEDDHEYIKRDFLKFAKKYKTDQFKEEVEQIDEVNEKQIKKDLDSGMSHDAVIGKHANKKLTNTDAIRKVIKQHAFDKRMKKEEVALDEMDKSQPSSSRGAEGLALGKKADPVKTDKVKSDALKLLQKRYRKVKEEVEQVEEAVTNNPGRGYHGQHEDDVADKKYSKMHAKVRTLTGTNSTMAKHYLDSAHGRHLAGYEDDHEYIKRDFLKFAKKYNADQFREEVDLVNEDQASDMQKIQSMDKGSMVGGKTELKTHLKYLNAMHTHQKKYGLDTAKTKKKIGDVSRSLVQMGEEVEQIDEIGNTEKGVDRLKKYVASDRSKVKIKDVLDAKRSADPDKAIEKLAKRQGYKSKALKKIRAFDAAKNPKPKEEPKPLHKMVYPDDMKYHGDSYEPTGDQALDERNMENKAKKDNVVRQIGAHAYIQGVKQNMQSPKIAGREVIKDPKLKSKKVSDMYRKLPNPMKKEEVEQVDEGSKRMSAAVKLQRAFDREKTASDASRKRGEEVLAQARAEYAKKQVAKTNEEAEQVDEGRRGRPPKDPAARAKFYAAVMDEPDQHIMMQLKKASDSEKPYHVTFKDGQKHPVEPAHAKKVIGKYMAMKPDEKKVYQKKIAKSHEHFMKAATEVEKPVAKKPLDQKQRMAAIAKAAMKNRNKGRDKSFGDTAD